MTDAPPQKTSLGRCGAYELLVELASGGMATVYLARASDGRDAPLVAIKRPHRHLAKDKIYLSMLVDEARLASAITHDNVVKVRELAFEQGEPFIVMNYVEGASLAEIRRELGDQDRSIDPRVAVRMAIDALAGLHAAHVLHDDHGRHLGIVHRDVSPHNVLVGCDGLARLTDFGIAKAADRVQETQTNEVKGKLAYLSPERIDRRRICTPQSDVFSMGVVLWECIAGRRLFRADHALDTLQEVVSAPIPSLRSLGIALSEELDAAILRGLARDLDERFASAADFGAALASAAGPENLAPPAEVARLVETLFGDQLRVRHEGIREALGDRDVEHVLEVSGLRSRPAPSPEMVEALQRGLDSVAPPAPSGRYAFGDGRPKRWGNPKLWIGIPLAALVLLGITAAIFATRASPRAEAAVAKEPALRSRRVVVTLPFAASHVTFDDEARDLSPPVDVAAFDVPREAGTRHRVTALAVDGTRAEAFVREEDGVVKPEGNGFALAALETTDEEGPRSDPPKSTPRRPPGFRFQGGHGHAGRAARDAGASSAKPVGTVKDGFTKLP